MDSYGSIICTMYPLKHENVWLKSILTNGPLKCMIEINFN